MDQDNTANDDQTVLSFSRKGGLLTQRLDRLVRQAHIAA